MSTSEISDRASKTSSHEPPESNPVAGMLSSSDTIPESDVLTAASVNNEQGKIGGKVEEEDTEETSKEGSRTVEEPDPVTPCSEVDESSIVNGTRNVGQANNPPASVTWVLSDSNENKWTPYVGGQKVPQSVRREWAAVFDIDNLSHASAEVSSSEVCSPEKPKPKKTQRTK